MPATSEARVAAPSYRFAMSTVTVSTQPDARINEDVRTLRAELQDWKNASRTSQTVIGATMANER
jgi:hypothetical protein